MPELPLRKRLYFGMGGLTMNLPDLIIMQWLIVRYMPPDGSKLIAPALCGLVVLLGRTMEGISNPIIAHWSDTSRARSGRRLPFMRFGLLPFALVFFLLFVPPSGELSWINFVYALLLSQAYFFLYSFIVTPYLSLLPEITGDLKERVDLTTAQAVFIMIGNFAFAGMGIVLARWGWPAAIGGAAGLIILFFLPAATALSEKHRPESGPGERLRFWHSIALTLKNRPFRYVLVCTSLYWFGLNGMIALVPYWVENYLGRGKETVTLLMAGFLVVSLLFFFVFNALARRFGKYALMLITFFGSALAMAGFALVGHLPWGGELLQTAVLMAALGAPVAGFMVLPFAVLADVIDYDETLTGRRREAMFFGMQGIAQKVMIGLSVLTFTLVPFWGDDGSRELLPGGCVIFRGNLTPTEEFQQLDEASDGEWKLVASGTWSREEGMVISDVADELKPFVRQPNTIRVEVSPAFFNVSWTLTGPDGYSLAGEGAKTVSDLAPGRYRVSWGKVPGWNPPEMPVCATPRGLKAMALLCGLACLAACVLFIRYPLRERDGEIDFENT